MFTVFQYHVMGMTLLSCFPTCFGNSTNHSSVQEGKNTVDMMDNTLNMMDGKQSAISPSFLGKYSSFSL